MVELSNASIACRIVESSDGGMPVVPVESSNMPVEMSDGVMPVEWSSCRPNELKLC